MIWYSATWINIPQIVANFWLISTVLKKVDLDIFLVSFVLLYCFVLCFWWILRGPLPHHSGLPKFWYCNFRCDKNWLLPFLSKTLLLLGHDHVIWSWLIDRNYARVAFLNLQVNKHQVFWIIGFNFQSISNWYFCEVQWKITNKMK